MNKKKKNNKKNKKKNNKKTNKNYKKKNNKNNKNYKNNKNNKPSLEGWLDTSIHKRFLVCKAVYRLSSNTLVATCSCVRRLKNKWS